MDLTTRVPAAPAPAPGAAPRPVRRWVLVLLALLVASALVAVLVGTGLLSALRWLADTDAAAAGASTSTIQDGGPSLIPEPTSGPLGEGDGMIPAGTDIVGAADLPGVARLDPALRAAVEEATADAALDGQELFVTTGWRSTRFQEQLYAEGLARYGSDEEARQYVATPETSTHVTGDAVDVGPLDAMYWLLEHGATYGLCQTYANEVWHFELATEAGGTCPEMLPDASYLGR